MDWYEFQADVLAKEKVQVINALLTGAAVQNSRLLGLAREEVEAFFQRQREELGFLAMLGLLAAAEAALRCDFQDRVEHRLKDSASRSFRDIYKKLRDDRQQNKVRLEEHILETWRTCEPSTRSAIGDFRGVLRLRHWLAHGRWWEPKLGRLPSSYSPADVYDTAQNLLSAVGV